MIMHLGRAFNITRILLKHGLNRHIVAPRFHLARALSYLNIHSYRANRQQRAKNIRIALEQLGPIFIKFGQLLSVRRDFLPDDIADELAKLQDHVPPFNSKLAQQMIEDSYQQPIKELFSSFDTEPLAAASIAQVHAAQLLSGEDVIIKILRPDIKKTIQKDITLMYFMANLIESYFKGGKRTHAIELVAEFEHTILHELDLVREAANASLLRRNFQSSTMMYVPKVYWQYVKNNIW